MFHRVTLHTRTFEADLPRYEAALAAAGIEATGRARWGEFALGPAGPRPQYAPSYHGGFLRDAEENSIEAVHHDGVRTAGVVDHVWVRVAGVDAAERFYAGLADAVGYERTAREPGLVRFRTAVLWAAPSRCWPASRRAGWTGCSPPAGRPGRSATPTATASPWRPQSGRRSRAERIPGPARHGRAAMTLS